MVRATLAGILASVALAAVPFAGQPQTAPAFSATSCPDMMVEPTYLCVAASFTVGGADKHEFVVIEWGDGTSDWVDCVRAGGPCFGVAPHTYAAPGTYTVTATAMTGCPGGKSAVAVDVVASPAFPLDVAEQGETWIQPATTDPLETGTIRRSTIDWGDGTPVEEFDWTPCGEGLLCAPQHDYSAAGEYTVVARIEYEGAWEGTCYERVATFDARVGPATPTRESTWGAVKSVYR